MLKLIRDDYDPGHARHYTYDNGLLEIRDDDSGAVSAGCNEVRRQVARSDHGRGPRDAQSAIRVPRSPPARSPRRRLSRHPDAAPGLARRTARPARRLRLRQAHEADLRPARGRHRARRRIQVHRARAQHRRDDRAGRAHRERTDSPTARSRSRCSRKSSASTTTAITAPRRADSPAPVPPPGRMRTPGRLPAGDRQRSFLLRRPSRPPARRPGNVVLHAARCGCPWAAHDGELAAWDATTRREYVKPTPGMLIYCQDDGAYLGSGGTDPPWQELEFQDEGIALAAISTVDFVGPGVTATEAAGVATVRCRAARPITAH